MFKKKVQEIIPTSEWSSIESISPLVVSPTGALSAPASTSAVVEATESIAETWLAIEALSSVVVDYSPFNDGSLLALLANCTPEMEALDAYITGFRFQCSLCTNGLDHL